MMTTRTAMREANVSSDVDEQKRLSEREDEDRLVPPPQAWFGEGDDNNSGDDENLFDHDSLHPSRGKRSGHTATNSNTVAARITESETSLQQSHVIQRATCVPDERRRDLSFDETAECQTEILVLPHHELRQLSSIGAPQKAPSWKELSSQVLPSAAKELLSSSMRRILHTARLSYAKGRWHRNYSDMGNPDIGYFRSDLNLPPFSSLPWIDRQLVQEWRTIGEIGEDDEEDFEKARTLVPQPLRRPKWRKADMCQTCRKPFGPTLLRHHCRLCGHSFCHAHSNQTHQLPHLAYDPMVPERVCLACKCAVNEQNLAERVAWRMARCRDFFDSELTPYFDTGIDTVEDAALRIAKAAITMARSIPLGAQAHVAVETVEVLRKYGLKGIYGLILKKEFLAAADLLCRACDINPATFPLSVHELSAAIFYALAQHRAIRGMSPEREKIIHAFRHNLDDNEGKPENASTWTLPDKNELAHKSSRQSVVDETDQYDPRSHSVTDLVALADAVIQEGNVRGRKQQAAQSVPHCAEGASELPFHPVCEPFPDDVLSSCLFYAPIALNFIYVERHVDMQLLAAQQGWRLLYAHLDQEAGNDRPGAALFLHEEQKIACFAVRGTATINDVATDIRQMPVPFPESDDEKPFEAGDWTPVVGGQGLAVCGMARAAVNLFREHVDVLSFLAKKSYKIRIVGHSLGAGVATLLGTLMKRHLENQLNVNASSLGGASQPNSCMDKNDLLRVYGFASPSCVDAKLSDYLKSFVTTVVLHDDVVPRLTPTSIRGLIKHLLHIRETWVQMHLKDDLMALTVRARSAWAPRWRSGFTLHDASGFCRKHIRYGKRKLLTVKGNLSRQISSPIEGVDSNASMAASASKRGDSKELTAILNDNDSCEGVPDVSLKLVVEYMGGIDKRADATIIDGDAFFDSEEPLIEGEDENADGFLEAVGEIEAEHLLESVSKHETLPCCEERSDILKIPSLQTEFQSDSELEDSDDHSAAVVLDETPLPRMFLPGKIVHIYTYRGVYKAAVVPKTFRELRRISMAGNMLVDHTCKAYFEALMEVQSARAAPEAPPTWTGFDEDSTCSCCASRFTWASTSDSEAQEARDKHNCRSCGTLCCDPCSRNRVPLPSIGLTIPVRVCDRCYNDMRGGVISKHKNDSTTDDQNGNLNDDCNVFQDEKSSQKERKRERRSLVVDELASRIHSTVTVHN